LKNETSSKKQDGVKYDVHRLSLRYNHIHGEHVTWVLRLYRVLCRDAYVHAPLLRQAGESVTLGRRAGDNESLAIFPNRHRPYAVLFLVTNKIMRCFWTGHSSRPATLWLDGRPISIYVCRLGRLLVDEALVG
jgi:hypothetical protein